MGQPGIKTYGFCCRGMNVYSKYMCLPENIPKMLNRQPKAPHGDPWDAIMCPKVPHGSPRGAIMWPKMLYGSPWHAIISPRASRGSPRGAKMYLKGPHQLPCKPKLHLFVSIVYDIFGLPSIVHQIHTKMHTEHQIDQQASDSKIVRSLRTLDRNNFFAGYHEVV